jgi:hypothetical protein
MCVRVKMCEAFFSTPRAASAPDIFARAASAPVHNTILCQIIAAQVDLLIAPFPVLATHRPVMRVALHAAPPQHFEPCTGAWSWLRVGRESCRAAAATGLGYGFAACEVMTLLHDGTQNGSSLLHELQALRNCANADYQHNAVSLLAIASNRSRTSIVGIMLESIKCLWKSELQQQQQQQ